MSDDVFRHFRAATAADDATLERLRESLAEELIAAEARRGRPGEEPPGIAVPDVPALPRIPARGGRLISLGTAAGATLGTALLAAAAAVTLVVLWKGRTPVDGPATYLLASQDGQGSLQIGEHTQVSYDGRGAVEGTTLRPRIDWERGLVAVEVDPNAGVDLVVRTREGEVHVVGTIFEVERGPLGTRVAVQRGKVDVTCEDAAGTTQRVIEGGEATCLPTTAGAMLGRARALQDAGRDNDEVMDSIDRGLRLAEPGAVLNELRVLRMAVLAGQGRPDAALQEATSYLSDGSPQRREEVVGLAVSLALGIDDCDVARPYLEELAEPGGAAVAQRLAACAASSGQ